VTTVAVRVRSTRASHILLSGFLATIALIGAVWWPLLRDYLAGYDPAYPWWRQTDFLLIGIFAAMTWLIMARADVRSDARLVAVGLLGGLVIETWGTRTGLWTYYTQERPPLWILPAWPIATLSIDRILHALSNLAPAGPPRLYRWLHLLVLGGFFLLMLAFVRPTWSEPSTLIALSACALLIARPTNERVQLLTFAAGTGLGYFLERWGTTRGCWTYYTLQTPPFFAVLAHGMAAVAFWRVLEASERWGRVVAPFLRRRQGSSSRAASST
jgi:hypothetical protein